MAAEVTPCSAALNDEREVRRTESNSDVASAALMRSTRGSLKRADVAMIATAWRETHLKIWSAAPHHSTWRCDVFDVSTWSRLCSFGGGTRRGRWCSRVWSSRVTGREAE